MKGPILVTTTQESRARRAPPRLPGALKGLCAGAIAAALFSLGSVAHADVFGGQTTNQDTEQLRQRLNLLEQEMARIKDGAGHSSAQSGSPGPGNLSLPEPPEVKASAPKTYRVVGEVNGRFLVRAGNARMLFTADELKKFDEEESVRALAQTTHPDAPPASGPGKPPAPPPAVGPTSRVGQAPVPPAKASSQPTPAKPAAQTATAKK